MADATDGSPLPDAGTAAWYHRQEKLPGGRWRVRCLFSDDHPDGTAVHDPDPDLGAGCFEIWRADLGADGRPRVLVSADAAPGAPTMWFVGLPEPDGDDPAMTLVGYASEVRPPGTVVPNAEFFHLPTRNEDQVGAIRWWRRGVVDQVYVGDLWRRRHVASALIYAASGYHQLHGWPGRLRSDGRRTVLGDHLVAGLRHPDRIAPLDQRMPAMDAPDTPEAPDAMIARTGDAE
jgi:hypothetical protein